MKKIMTLIFTLILVQNVSAKSHCGKAFGFAYNMDTIERPYQLSGFWVEDDIRVTWGNSPELVEKVNGLQGNVFVCLDEYTLQKKPWAKKLRTYAYVTKFRIWLDGELLD